MQFRVVLRQVTLRSWLCKQLLRPALLGLGGYLVITQHLTLGQLVLQVNLS